MFVAKVASLSVRPVQVSLLCFEVNGILAESFVKLGARVFAFDFAPLYKAFRDAITGSGPNSARLQFDSDGIDRATQSSIASRNTNPNDLPTDPRSRISGNVGALASLRAEAMKAALNKAVNSRESAVFSKYANAHDTVLQMRQAAGVKTDQLTALSSFSQKQTDLLDATYVADGRTGVVRTCNTVTTSSQTNSGTSTTTGAAAGTSQAKGTVDEKQKIENTDYGYRTPQLENLARNKRAQIGLADEQLSNFIQNQNLANLELVFKNELSSIDKDVNQLQIAYLNTILLSPIDGFVTGLYKNPGDAVSAGEPVVRVENNSDVYLTASLVCREPISIGSVLEITTKLFESNSSFSVDASVVAVRGGREDDQWEVIATCSNLDATGKILFPIGYQFDYDNTTVTKFEPGEPLDR